MDKVNPDEEEEEETSDIREYLVSFNKEIEEDEESDCMIDQDSDDCLSPDNLCGYLSAHELDEEIKIKEEPEDDEDFYTIASSPTHNDENDKDFPRKRAEIIRLGAENRLKGASEINLTELSDDVNDDATAIPAIGEELHIDDQQALELVAQLAEQATNNVEIFKGLDSGNAYQAVTIVPSDTNPGELSYVLFVSDADDGLEKTDDVVYNPADFDDTFLMKQSGHKMRAIRLGPHKSQMLSQHHRCSYCSYTSPKRYLLSRHMKSHSDERPHRCGVCERGFKTVASLQNHVNTHTGTRPHPCKECDSCFTTSGELVRHIRYKHTHEKPHKCTECDYASVELSKLKRHMRCHTGERPYQCPHCTYASPDTYKLKRHLRIHTGEKPYECDICQTRFTQSNSLKAHRLIHTGDKPIFQCEYCPTTCGRKTDLRIHMEKLHSSNKPHRCKRCGKVFLDRYSYKLHIRTHDGEKCYKCDLCDYASISHRHLETHMFVHTDQKPFLCDECDMSFRQKQLLKRHKNLYHNPTYVKPEPREKTHLCSVCDKAFRHKGNLLRHYAIHDPEATAADREIALKLGLPKELGEDQDGEEDDLKEEEEEDQQVVVFEVIQLPGSNLASSDSHPFSMVDGNSISLTGLDSESYSIIQSVDDMNGGLFYLQDQAHTFEDFEKIADVNPSKTMFMGKRKSPLKSNVHIKENQPVGSSKKARRGRPPGSKNKKTLQAQR